MIVAMKWVSPGNAVLTGIVALAAWVGLAPALRAAGDHIEDELIFQASEVLNYLKEKNYQNVGVLKFRAHIGNEKESFKAGPINVTMTTRLENALVRANQKGQPLGIIREAAQVAFDHKEQASYLTPDGLDKLFRYKYPLYWGNDRVEADVFVTGCVQLSPDKNETTIRIEAIDRKTRKLQLVRPFTVRTERTILEDFHQNFRLTSKDLRKRTPAEQDKLAVDNAAGRESKPSDDAVQPRNVKPEDPSPPRNVKPEDPSPPTPVKPPDKIPVRAGAREVELEIFYDNSPVPIQAVDRKEFVREPEEGQRIFYRLTNRGDQPKAVVLTVNGENTLYREPLRDLTFAGCSRWVLLPGKKCDVEGFYKRDNKTFEPFKVISDQESSLEEEQNLSLHLGQIHMVVFAEGERLASVKPTGLRKRLPIGERKPPTARAAAQLARETAGVKPQMMGYIKPDTSKLQNANLKDAPFNDPQEQESRVIIYRSKNNSRP